VLSVSRTTLYGLLASGAIRSVKVGGLRRIPVEALENYVMHLSDDPGAPSSTPSTEGTAVVGTTTSRAGQPPGDGLLDDRDGTGDRQRSQSVRRWTDGQAPGGHPGVAP
jgi:excisionase family DNA binding protein